MVPLREFNSFGARRGNHQVMMRGTFGNVRLRNDCALIAIYHLERDWDEMKELLDAAIKDGQATLRDDPPAPDFSSAKPSAIFCLIAGCLTISLNGTSSPDSVTFLQAASLGKIRKPTSSRS